MRFSGQLLAEAREAKKMNRELLAGLVGVSVQTITNAETDAHTPSADNVAKIAAALGIPIEDLFFDGGGEKVPA